MSELTVWMRCPYDPELCGADATLTMRSADDSGWSGLLVCANDHRFVLSQWAAADDGLLEPADD